MAAGAVAEGGSPRSPIRCSISPSRSARRRAPRQYGAVADGVLDWGAVDVLGARRGADAARRAARSVHVVVRARRGRQPGAHPGVPGATTADQDEKFLFYRGLGNFELPVTVDRAGGRQGQPPERLRRGRSGGVFVINVERGRGRVRRARGRDRAGRDARRRRCRRAVRRCRSTTSPTRSRREVTARARRDRALPRRGAWPW